MGISTAVQPSSVARVLGIETKFKARRNSAAVMLPQRVALIGQGSSAAVYSTTKAQHTSAASVAAAYGYGSPLHLAAMQFFPAYGGGIGTIPLTVYPLADAPSSTAASGTITPAGTPTAAASYVVRVNNIDSLAFVFSIGDTLAARTAKIADAINSVLSLPIIATATATNVGVVSKWKGASANGIKIEIIGAANAGNTFAIVDPIGGLINPDVDAALAQFGNVWESMVLNCLDIADTATLDKYKVFGEGRWGALVKKPLVVFTGNTATSVAAATAVSNARKTDLINSQLPCPESRHLPFVVAAAQLAQIVVRANSDPAHDYGSLQVSSITAGSDGAQWNYAQRDEAVKKGSSTIELRSGAVNISDVVTFYHPDGDDAPPYRYVADIVKLQNALYNFDLQFDTPEWDGAPLIPDNQPTANRSAKKPKMFIALAASIIDNLAMAAILSDPEASKAALVGEIDPQNSKRFNMIIPVTLSGNTNIKSFDLAWSFYAGAPENTI